MHEDNGKGRRRRSRSLAFTTNAFRRYALACTTYVSPSAVRRRRFLLLSPSPLSSPVTAVPSTSSSPSFPPSRSPTCSSCSWRVRRRYRRLYACTCTCTPLLPASCRLAVFLPSRFPRIGGASGMSEGSRHPEDRRERPSPREAHTRRRGGGEQARRSRTKRSNGGGKGHTIQRERERETSSRVEGCITRRERKAEFVASARRYARRSARSSKDKKPRRKRDDGKRDR